jgi:glycosyltransferase involved in cell wall biosynthesis
MKILFVSPYLPGPPVFGGQRRIHGLMTALAKRHEISLISLIDPDKDNAAGLGDAKSFCREVVTVSDRLHRVSGRMKRVLQLRSLLSRQSWEQKLHRRPAFQRALERHLGEQRYDVVNCEFVFMSGYRFDAKMLRGASLVLDEHNVEYDILARTTAQATRFDRKLYNSVNHLKLKHEEVKAWKRFDGITFTSDRDREVAQQEAPSARMAVIPNGVDVDAFRPLPEDQRDPNVILFFGAINYFPNSDAVDFFLKDVFPLLSAKHPQLKVRIVGPGASDEVKALANGRVEVVGFVDDLRAEIARAGVVVAPLRIGGGTRLKILEAMAVAKPIVSTRLGAEGIDVQHERDILLADSPQELVREIERVVADPALSARLGEAARRTAEQHYSWAAAAERMAQFYGTLPTTSPGRAREAIGAEPM